MKAFLSYSLRDSDLFVIPLVTQKLQKQGFFVSNGSYKTGSNIDAHTLNEINTSSLFIGVITNTGDSNERVYVEWLHSRSRKIPSFLLVDKTYNLNPDLEGYADVIRFDKHSPSSAIENIRFQINKSKKATNNQLDDAVPWLIGGAALIALIALLSSD